MIYEVDIVQILEEGKVIAPVNLIGSQSDPLLARLQKLRQDVAAELTDSLLPASNVSPLSKLAKYKADAEAALGAVKDDGPTVLLFNGPAVFKIEGKDTDFSIWSDKLDGWEPLEGVSLEFLVTMCAQVPIPQVFGGSGLLNLTDFGSNPTAMVESAPQRFHLNIAVAGQTSEHRCIGKTLVARARGNGAAGVVLYFSPTRTRIINVSYVVPERSNSAPQNVLASHSVSPLPSAPSHTAPMRDLGNGVFWLQAPIDLSSGLVEYEVVFEGDPPHLRGATTLYPNGPRVEDAPPRKGLDPLPEPPLEGNLRSFKAVRTYGVTAAEAGKLRSKLVRKATAFKESRKFFLELDSLTHPDLRPDNTYAFDGLGLSLASRYFRRAEFRHFHETLAWTPSDVKPKEDQAKEAGALILRLIHEHFTESIETGFAKTAAAFEQFASGRLTEVDTFGAPNGLNYLGFAELAILMREIGEDKATWDALFHIFCYTSELYMACYHECRAPRTRCAYKVANNPEGQRAAGQGFIDSIRKTWALARDLEERYNDLVHAALYDDLPVAPETKSPIALTDYGCGI